MNPGWLLGIVLLAPTQAATRGPAVTVADVVILADDRPALGQWTAPAGSRSGTFLIRRDWVRARLPEWSHRWEAAEAILVRQARRERAVRLAAWRAERTAHLDEAEEDNDPFLPAIDRELVRLADPRPPLTPILAAVLVPGEVRAVQKRPDAAARLLRLGWLADLPGVESMPPEQVRAALLRRGPLPDPTDSAPIDALLPLLPESDAQWRARRAATEIVADPARLRLVQYQQFVFPERAPVPIGNEFPNRLTLLDTPAAMDGFRAILGIVPENSLDARLDAVAARGGVGLVLTQLVIPVDFTRVELDSTLWVRRRGDAWVPLLSRRLGRLVPDDEDNDRVPLWAGSTVQMTLAVLDSVSATPLAADFSARRRRAGALAQRAVDQLHQEFDRILLRLALPLLPPRP